MSIVAHRPSVGSENRQGNFLEWLGALPVAGCALSDSFRLVRKPVRFHALAKLNAPPEGLLGCTGVGIDLLHELAQLRRVDAVAIDVDRPSKFFEIGRIRRLCNPLFLCTVVEAQV